LVALNRLWRCGWSVDELAQLGLSLGADVPVFIRGQAAWGEGVGERLTPLQLPQPWYLVVTPPCEVSTAEIFGDPELTRDTPKITITDFLAGQGHNDCLSVVRRRYPPVAQALDWLAAQGAQARLTGTGASVFATFTDQAQARQLLMKLPAEFRGLVAQGRNRSVLLDVLDSCDDRGCGELE
jgi:4-diphosphocytidyl-2-C-methyl-D-erythritol kinase